VPSLPFQLIFGRNAPRKLWFGDESLLYTNLAFSIQPHTRNAGHQIAVLDFGQYDADDLKVILSWLYTGELPDHDILAERIFDIFIITDFLLVGVLKADCYNFMRKVSFDLKCNG